MSNRVQAVVHKGLFYVGLASRRYVGSVGEEQIIDVKVVDLEEEAVAGVVDPERVGVAVPAGGVRVAHAHAARARR